MSISLFTDPELSRNSTNKKTFVHLIDSGGQPSFISLVPAFVRGSTVNIVASKLNHSINDKLQYEYVKDDQHLRQPTKLEKSQLEGIEELIRTLSSVKHSEKGRSKGSSEPKFLLVGTHADKHWSLFEETLSGKNRWLKKSLGELKSMCIEVSPDGDILLPINTRVTKGRNEVASSIRQKIMDACSDAEVDIPTRWYVFELEVSGKAKKEGRSVLGRAECIEVGGYLSMAEEDVMAALDVPVDALLLPCGCRSGAGGWLRRNSTRWIELNHLHLLCDVFEVGIVIELRPRNISTAIGFDAVERDGSGCSCC